MSTVSTAGLPGCPCANVSSILASLAQRSCMLPDGSDGVMLSVEGPCAPHTYGSSTCARHDQIHDPKCSPGEGEPDAPDWCAHSFCYVEAKKCKQDPMGRARRSAYFPHELGIDLVRFMREVGLSYAFRCCTCAECSLSKMSVWGAHGYI